MLTKPDYKDHLRSLVERGHPGSEASPEASILSSCEEEFAVEPREEDDDELNDDGITDGQSSFLSVTPSMLDSSFISEIGRQDYTNAEVIPPTEDQRSHMHDRSAFESIGAHLVAQQEKQQQSTTQQKGKVSSCRPSFDTSQNDETSSEEVVHGEKETPGKEEESTASGSVLGEVLRASTIVMGVTGVALILAFGGGGGCNNNAKKKDDKHETGCRNHSWRMKNW